MGEKGFRDVLRSLDPINIEADPIELSKVFGSRFHKAWQILEDHRVKKYVFQPTGRSIWIVVGKQREYLIYEKVGFCSCEDFFFAVMEGTSLVCPHLIAQRLAEELSDYDVVEAEDELFSLFMGEWRPPSSSSPQSSSWSLSSS